MRWRDGIAAGMVDPDTGYPAGHLICPACQVSWSATYGGGCWICAAPGLTPAAYLNRRSPT